MITYCFACEQFSISMSFDESNPTKLLRGPEIHICLQWKISKSFSLDDHHPLPGIGDPSVPRTMTDFNPPENRHNSASRSNCQGQNDVGPGDIDVDINYTICNSVESHSGDSRYLHKKFKRGSITDIMFINSGVKSRCPTNEFIMEDSEQYNDTPHICSDSERRRESRLGLQGCCHICPYCRAVFPTYNGFQKHVKAHQEENPYSCVPRAFAPRIDSYFPNYLEYGTHAAKILDEDAKEFQGLQVSGPLSGDSGGSGTGKIDVESDFFSVKHFSSSIRQPKFTEIFETSYNSKLNRIPNSDICTNLISNFDNEIICHCEKSRNDCKPTRIYKPKFHSTLFDCSVIDTRTHSLQEERKSDRHLQRIANNDTRVTEQCPRSPSFLTAESKKISMSRVPPGNSRERHISYNLIEARNHESCKTMFEDSESPVLHLKHRRTYQPRAPHLSKVKVLVKSDSGVMYESLKSHEDSMLEDEIQRGHKDTDVSTLTEVTASTCAHSSQSRDKSEPGSKSTAVVVRPSLHSGGVMLHKTMNNVLDHRDRSRSSSSFSRSEESLSCLLGLKKTLLDHKLKPTIDKRITYSSIARDPPSYPSDSLSLNVSNPTIHSKVIQKNENGSPSAENINGFNKSSRPTSLHPRTGKLIPKQHCYAFQPISTIYLCSPETPRPEESYGQLHLDGYAYTYLGLKCPTRLFYCTLNRLQPMYAEQQRGLSMYSNWEIHSNAPIKSQLTHHSGRELHGYTLAHSQFENILTHSSQNPSTSHSSDSGLGNGSDDKIQRRLLSGGFGGSDEYTYIRGRGRGRFVCEECGIRCKKPSMLQKHMKTHTNVRPYTCRHCSFSFKTKGNLTKHLKSKMHHKKSFESEILSQCDVMPIGDLPTDGCPLSMEYLNYQPCYSSEGTDTREVSEDSGSEEREVVTGLLSSAKPFTYSHFSGLFSITRPFTYPYTRNSGNSRSGPHEWTIPSGSTENSHIIGVSMSSTKKSPSLGSSTSILESELSTIYLCKRKQDQSISPVDLTINNIQANKIHRSTNRSDTSLDGSSPIHCETPDLETKFEDKQTHESCFIVSGSMLPIHRGGSDHIIRVETVEINRSRRSLDLDHSVRESNAAKSSVSKVSKEFPECKVVDDVEYKRNSQENSVAPETELTSPKFQVSANHVDRIVSNCDKNYSAFSATVDKAKSPSRNVNSGLLKDRMVPLLKNVDDSSARRRNLSTYFSMTEDGLSICSICNKVFNKPSQLKLHINIHYFERPFRCDSCGISFRTKGHLMKHERSSLHQNKVHMTSAFGAPTANNPRPFKCSECKSAFRIHGHLAKHLRSKMHIMKLECLHKLPFGTYAEIERSGISLNKIDTTDCSTSLTSLQILAHKLSKGNSSERGHTSDKLDSPLDFSDDEISSDEGTPVKNSPVSEKFSKSRGQNHQI